MHCNNGLNNKLVESLVENKVAQETGDLKYLQDSMYDFVSTLKEIILGEYSPEFFNEYVDEALKLHGSNLEEFLKIPKMGLELRHALNSIDEAMNTSNQEFRDNLVLLLERFQTTLDNMEYEARSPYDVAVKYGYKGTEAEWIADILNDSELLNKLRDGTNTLTEYIDTIPITVSDAITDSILSSGFITIDSFEVGATLTQRNEALRHAADGKLYRWAGDLPKVVPASSTPSSSGGYGTNAWLEVSDTTLRQELTNADIGAAMVGFKQEGVGAAERTLADKAREWVSVDDFGAVGDAEADDTDAIEAALAYALTQVREHLFSTFKNRPVVVFNSTSVGYRTTREIIIPPTVDVLMHSPIIYDGPSTNGAVVHGNISTSVFTSQSVYRVIRKDCTWSTNIQAKGEEVDIGLKLINFDSSDINIPMCQRFEIGVLAIGDARGFAYNSIKLGYLIDNKVQLWLASKDGGWANENQWYGGRYSIQRSVAKHDAVGIRALRLEGGDSNHNNNTFYSPSFEHLGDKTGSGYPVIDAVHFAQSRILYARDENNGPIFMKEGEDAIENEVSWGYSPLGVTGRVDSSEARNPSSTVSRGARQRHLEVLSSVLWDSGNLKDLACYVDADNRLNLTGFTHARVSNTTDLKELSPNIRRRSTYLRKGEYGISAEGSSIDGFFKFFKVEPNSQLHIIRSDEYVDDDSISGNSLRYVVYDKDFVQLSSGDKMHVKGRVNNGVSFYDNYFGGHYVLNASTAKEQFISLSDEVHYIAVFVNVRSTSKEIISLSIRGKADTTLTPINIYEDIHPSYNVGIGPPTTGYSSINQFILNVEPTAGSPHGWRCIESGNPGVWEELTFVTPEPIVPIDPEEPTP